MKSKWILFLVTLVIVVPLLVACSGGSASTPTTKPTTPASTPTPTTPRPTATPTPTTPTPTPTPTATKPASSPTPSPTQASTIPVIKHTLEGRSDCLLCHGASGPKPMPASTHANRTNDTCTTCHKPA